MWEPYNSSDVSWLLRDAQKAESSLTLLLTLYMDHRNTHSTHCYHYYYLFFMICAAARDEKKSRISESQLLISSLQFALVLWEPARTGFDWQVQMLVSCDVASHLCQTAGASRERDCRRGLRNPRTWSAPGGAARWFPGIVRVPRSWRSTVKKWCKNNSVK